MTPEQQKQLQEIQQLLKQGYDDYFARSDGYCKRGEGAIQVYYPNYFEICEGMDPLTAVGIEVYSYALGPSRAHFFESFEEALGAVKEWVRMKNVARAAKVVTAHIVGR